MLRQTFAAALLLCPQMLPAQDWSGEYKGYFVCDHVQDGDFSQIGRPLSLKIKQDGNALVAQAEAVVGETDDGSPSLYRGELVSSTAVGDTQAGYLEACTGAFDYKELVRIFPATTGGATFGFAADTIFYTKDLPGLEGQLMIESCKWAMERVSTEVPEINGC